MKKGVNVHYCNILESLECLTEFLKIRDKSELYYSIKKEGRIGIPLIIFNNNKMILGGRFDEIDRILEE